MPLFEFEAGHLVPAQVGHALSEPIEPAVLDAVRAQVLDLLQLPVLPVTWQDDDGGARLTAMDAAGQVVSVEVLDRLDAVALVSALGRAGQAKGRGWIDVARSYPSGVGGFRRDWNSFREAQPAGAGATARVHILAAQVDESVRPALDALAGAGVVIHELAVRAMSNGRLFLDVAEISVPVAPLPWLLPGRMGTQAVTDRPAVPEVAPATPERRTAPPATSPPADDLTTPPAGTPAPPTGDTARRPVPPTGDTARRPVPPTGDTTPAADDPSRATDDATLPAGGTAPSAAGEDLLAICAGLDGPVTLVWAERGPRREATLTPQGQIVVGRSSFADPEAAAAALAGGSARGDAWGMWRFGDHGPSLREAREEILAHRARSAHRGQPGRRSASPGLRRRDRRRRATSE